MPELPSALRESARRGPWSPELLELDWNGLWALFLPEARRRSLAGRFERAAAAALD